MLQTVRDVMTVSVVTVREEASFQEIAVTLRHRGISALPVSDSTGYVTGVVSEADLLLKEASPGQTQRGRALWHKAGRTKAAALTAAALMTSPAVTTGPYCLVEDAARVMLRERVKRLPVIDEDGSLIGIVSRADLLGVYDRPDSDICEQVVNDVIRRSFLLEPGTARASVADGVVTVAGEVESSPVALSIIEAVWHINGVVDVHDRLRWPGRRMGHQTQQDVPA